MQTPPNPSPSPPYAPLPDHTPGPAPQVAGSDLAVAASSRARTFRNALSIAPMRSLKRTSTFSTLTICSSSRDTRSADSPAAPKFGSSSGWPLTRTAWRPNVYEQTRPRSRAMRSRSFASSGDVLLYTRPTTARHRAPTVVRANGQPPHNAATARRQPRQPQGARTPKTTRTETRVDRERKRAARGGRWERGLATERERTPGPDCHSPTALSRYRVCGYRNGILAARPPAWRRSSP